MTNATVEKTVANLPTLADRMMLAVLRGTPLKTSKRMDEDTQEAVREFVGDESAFISTALFKDKTNPVRQIIMLDSQMYSTHTKMTAPWVDAGPRLLPSNEYDNYRRVMTDYSDRLNDMRINRIIPHWDELVQKDIDYRRQAALAEPDAAKREKKLARISFSEYPTKAEAEGKWHRTFRVRPIGSDDSRTHIPEWQREQMRADLMAELADAERKVTIHIVAKMLEPIEKAIENLEARKVDGTKIFRDSTMENLKEKLEMVDSINCVGDPKLDAAIAAAKLSIHAKMGTAEQIRTQHGALATTLDELKELKDTFSGLK